LIAGAKQLAFAERMNLGTLAARFVALANPGKYPFPVRALASVQRLRRLEQFRFQWIRLFFCAIFLANEHKVYCEQPW
jgi:hypothetical protein